MDDRVYLVWLSLACTPGSKTFAKLLTKYNSPHEIYEAKDYEIDSLIGSKDLDSERLKNKDLEEATRINEFCTTKKVGILSYFDEAFPENLRLISNPPVMLYYRGKLPDFKHGFRLGVVGTRSLSDYGRINAFHLGYDMGCAGATIVSGMAKGIDGVAHAGALAAGAINIAFLGSGIDVCYPEIHTTLARAIVKEGCIFTEFKPGTRPYGPNFPVRNRLISGISHAVVVVEAPYKSGALITASKAKEQGRPVFAYPGNVGAEGSQATNTLIKNGAILCTSADDIVMEYENVACTGLNPFKMPTKRTVNMNAVLTEYRVCCTTGSDIVLMNPYERRSNKVGVFEEPPPPKTRLMRQNEDESATLPRATENAEPVLKTKENEQGYAQVVPIDKEAIRIYKKIPLDCAISITELEDENTGSAAVMSSLLKLELSSFVTILPGDKVMRKMK